MVSNALPTSGSSSTKTAIPTVLFWTLPLANLPGVGALFRERMQTSTKTELIVLLTPRIWNPHTGVMSACPAPAGPFPAMPTQHQDR